MAAVATRRLPVLDEPPRPAQPRLFALPGGAPETAEPVHAGSALALVSARAAATPTLDALLTASWSALAGGQVAACPVCSGDMAPRWSAGAGAVGGRCDSCGSTLE
jgi:hypothetical protein